MPLRYGAFNGKDIACCYHGWTFGLDGGCIDIPAAADGQALDPSRIRVKSYPCREVQGNVWIFMSGRQGGDGAPLPEVPRLPDIGDTRPQVAISMRFPCGADHAAFGLVDPAHGAFVHTSWWWKKGPGELRLKEKAFEPSPLGFRMRRHRLPRENRVYKLLGDNVTSEITFSLPGVRVEHIKGERHTAVNLTAVTPVNEEETDVHQCLYWTVPWLGPFKPIARTLSRIFLGQDRDTAVRLNDGLAHKPPLMFVGDPDAQIKWYLRLKREWLRAQAEGREFRNPLRPTTLRWRS
jgi:phenylpropionate dioxygenase-like ring-hydroxylating dioxygenase large terminal subunit